MKQFISWNVIDECVTDIAEHLVRTDIEFTGIYGIPRGGTVLGVMLSHKLDIPYITSLEDIIFTDENFIIIDDIVDTGETLEKYKKIDIEEQAYYVTIHEHEDCTVRPDYSILYKEDKWIVYPWEIRDSAEIQDYLI